MIGYIACTFSSGPTEEEKLLSRALHKGSDASGPVKVSPSAESPLSESSTKLSSISADIRRSII